MTYELWDMGSGNLLDEFETRQEAVTCVSELLEDGNPKLVNRLALFGPDATGKRSRLAEGTEILKPTDTESTRFDLASSPKRA